jgi:hypothetical protein
MLMSIHIFVFVKIDVVVLRVASKKRKTYFKIVYRM